MPRKPKLTATPTEEAEIAAADLSLSDEDLGIGIDLDFSSLDDDLGSLGSVVGTVSEDDVVRAERNSVSAPAVSSPSPSAVSSDRSFVEEIISVYRDRQVDLDTHLDLLLKGIMNVAQTVNQSFALLDEKLIDLNSRLDKVESSFSGSGKEYASVRKRLDEIEEDLTRRFSTMAEDVANLIQKEAPVAPPAAVASKPPKASPAAPAADPVAIIHKAPQTAPEASVAAVVESSTECSISPAIAHQILTALRSLKRPVQVKSLVSYLAGNLIHRGIDVTPEEIERWMYDEGLVDSNGVVSRQGKD